jgi:hypothetical protein
MAIPDESQYADAMRKERPQLSFADFGGPVGYRRLPPSACTVVLGAERLSIRRHIPESRSRCR